MIAKMDETTIEELLRRPYRKIIQGDPVEGYLAEAPELPGCFTAGETDLEALELLQDAMAGWFESRLANGLSIPEPSRVPGEPYSGRILLRIPPAVHRQLVEQAREQGVSLNQWALTVLLEGMNDARLGAATGPRRSTMGRNR